MFERFTEKARRSVFFARWEASQFGSPYIESEHLLLGLLRESRELTRHFLGSRSAVADIRRTIEARTSLREKISTSVDMPISNECKRILTYAAEEAERLGSEHVGTEHLLLGILRETNCLAAEILTEQGVVLQNVREAIANNPDLQRRRQGTSAFFGGQAVSSRARLVFIEAGERVAVVPFGDVGQAVPRMGEEIVLASEVEGRRLYRVTAVKHIYEHYLADVPNAPYRLTGVIVSVQKESAQLLTDEETDELSDDPE